MGPAHIGIVPDGCRRWAKKNSVSLSEGYKIAFDHLYDFCVEWCFLDYGIPYVTAFGLSVENVTARSKDDVDSAIDGLTHFLTRFLEDKRVVDNGIGLKALGTTELLPSKINSLISKANDVRKNNTRFQLTLCLVYSGKWEILRSVSKIASDVQSKRIDPADITEKTIAQSMPSYPTPDFDIMIRTAEHRISNFSLWNIAYAEVYFIPKYFPDLTKEDLKKVLVDFQSTERRFGGDVH